MEAGRAARDVGLGMVATVRAVGPQALLTLVALKAAWLVLGYAGLLPRAFGGAEESWDLSRRDGWASWLLALGAVAAVAWWLRRGTAGRALSERSMALAPLLLVGVIAAADVAFQLVAAVLMLTSPLPRALDPQAALLTLGGVLDNLVHWPPLVAVGVGLVLGGVLWTRSRERGAALLLLAFGLWSAPRAAALLVDFLAYPWYPWGYLAFTEQSGQRPG